MSKLLGILKTQYVSLKASRSPKGHSEGTSIIVSIGLSVYTELALPSEHQNDALG